MSELAEVAQESMSQEDQQFQTIRALVRQQEGAIREVLPDHSDPKRFARTLLIEVRRNPKLLRCDAMSLLGAVMLGAQLRLEFGPLGHAYLLPFGKEVTFVPGYKGMIDLALRSPKTESVIARAVFDGDQFDYGYGLDDWLTHVPQRDVAEDPEKLTHVYAIGRLRDASRPVFKVLTREDVHTFRDRSPSWKAKQAGKIKQTTWDTDYIAMATKTAIRRLFPFLPVSAELAPFVGDESDELRVPAGQPLVSNMLDDIASEGATTVTAEVDPDDDGEGAEEGEVIEPDGEPEPPPEEPPADAEDW